MSDDRDGAIWAFGENVDQTRSESAVHLSEAAIDGLGESAVHFDIDESGESVTAISIVYFQIGSYASGVLVAGSDRTGALRIAIEIARRQLARQVRTA